MGKPQRNHSKEKNKPKHREWVGHSPYSKAMAETAKTSTPR
jgi:hypothetical protein